MAARGRRWILALTIVAGAIFLIDVWRYAGHQLDDSFITFRYARNLVEGHGLVFNPGERVEGYTNLLFVLLSAAFIRLGIDPLLGTTIVTAIAALAALASTALLYREVTWRSEVERIPAAALVNDPESDRRQVVASASLEGGRAVGGWALSAVALLLTTEAFAYWSVVSMETMLFTALLSAGLLLLIRTVRTGRGRLVLSIPFALLVLTRPDGAAVAVIAFTLATVMESRRRGDWSHVVRLAPAAAITGAAIAALIAWRLVYYGRLVPNTFHAKVTGGAGPILTGLAYLRDWSLASPLLAAAIVAPLGLLSSRVRARLGREHPAGLVWAVALFVVMSGVALGGDSMPFFRFFVPAMPLLAVVAAVGAGILIEPGGANGPAGQPTRGAERSAAQPVQGEEPLAHPGRGENGPTSPGQGAGSFSPRSGSGRGDSPGHPRAEQLAWLVPLALLVSAAASHFTIQPYRAFVAHRTALVGAAVGKWFARELPAGGLMAINTVGALPWESKLPTLDMLGLTDAAIASRPVWVASAGWAGHRRGWGAYVMGRRPAAILWYNSAGSAEPFYLGDRELAADPYFRFFYRQRIARLPALDHEPDGGVEGAEGRAIDGDPTGDETTPGVAPSEAAARRPGLQHPDDEEIELRPASSEAVGDAAGRPADEEPEPGDASTEAAGGAARRPDGQDPNDDEPIRKPGRRAGRVGSARTLARFPGYPFGFHPSGSSVAPELGVRAVFRETPIPHTTFVEHPITVHWFELDPRDIALWPLRERHAQAIEAFVQDVAAAWQEGVGELPGDPDAGAFVEALCREAYRQVEAGDFDGAKATLARAAAANVTARVPIVYQYMANVGVVTGDLLAAVPAQKEALRLEPENRLYAQNLARLLMAPFGEVPGMARLRQQASPLKRE